MIDFDALVSKYAGSGVLVDSNVLLLYVVGLFRPGRIETFTRTRRYTVDDFYLLQVIVGHFQRLVVTPNTLTEVANLASQMEEPDRSACRDILASTVTVVREEYVASMKAVGDRDFRRLGLTDSAILTLERSKYLILTDDRDLYLTLEYRKMDVINFNHVRAFV